MQGTERVKLSWPVDGQRVINMIFDHIFTYTQIYEIIFQYHVQLKRLLEG